MLTLFHHPFCPHSRFVRLALGEYGITVRWNKNFLKIIRLLLERRVEVPMFGGVLFGGKPPL